MQQHGLKVVQRSFKGYVDIKTLNSDDFAEWLRQQCVVEHEVIQVLKGQCFICKLINYEKLVRECSNCFALDAEWTHLRWRYTEIISIIRAVRFYMIKLNIYFKNR